MTIFSSSSTEDDLNTLKFIQKQTEELFQNCTLVKEMSLPKTRKKEVNPNR